MQSVYTYFNSNRLRFVKELCDYVRFPSVSADVARKPDVVACATWLRDYCERAGLHAKLCSTLGNPVILAKTRRSRSSRRAHFVVYGHYDVQPPDPLELWKTPPFEPTIKGRSLLGRGASDNKGQHLAHLQAVEGYLKTGTELPCDLTFLIEGEEEVGSKNLGKFLKQHQADLRCDAVVISDTSMPSPRHPALIYALRGLATLEVKLIGPSRDLHSGMYGGSVQNPAMALCQLLAQLHDKDGSVTIPGFYDDVLQLSADERTQLARLPFQEREYRRFLGVPQLFGERGYTPIEQRSARPTLEINGLTSGYQGEGSKTIVPSWANVKLTMRLVPNQKPKAILKLVQNHLRRICLPTVRLQMKCSCAAEPYIVSPQNVHAQAGLRALKRAFNAEPVLMRDGVSIPIIGDFKRILRADSLLLGLGLPDDNLHAPNEKFSLDNFAKGRLLSAHLWQELTAG